MALIWEQKCKLCGYKFSYSDFSLKQEFVRGYSRPERCPGCRKFHSDEIRKTAYPFFSLKPRKRPFPILGLPYLGQIRYVNYADRIPKSKTTDPHPEKMKTTIGKEELQKFYEALKKHQVIIVAGPTGCGKSTFLPYKLLEPLEEFSRDFFTKNGPIIITQPRIPPTVGIPLAIGENYLGSPVGTDYEIGYRFHGAEKLDHLERKIKTYNFKYSRLILVTDGSLLNWIEEGKLDQFSMIIVDEAHERSCNIDLILTLLKRELPKYPHLKLIISSATIDTKSFIDAFKDITEPYLLKLPRDRKFEIEDRFSEKNIPIRELPEALAKKIIEILKTTDKGGILGFLPGQAEIKRAIEKIKNSLSIIPQEKEKWGAILGYLPEKGEISLSWVFPMYRELGERLINEEVLKEEIEPVSFKGKKIIPRRIIIATNILETSSTVPDAIYAVDSGMIKQAEWDSDTRTLRLNPIKHSQDGCWQRRGRIGRTQKGYFYTLYTKEEVDNENIFPKYTSPEITRSCLESPLLTLKTFGIKNLKNIPWISPPKELEIESTMKILEERGIIKGEDITEKGIELWKLQRSLEEGSIDDASLLILADRFGCLIEAIITLKFRQWVGANYHPNKLFRWEPDWTAETKMTAAAIHDGLKIGCKDDLDLIMKLILCYLKANEEGKGEEWAKNHFINEEFLRETLFETKDILELFSKEKNKERFRKAINLSFLERLRIIMAVAWPDRIINLNLGNPVIFQIKTGSESKIGVVSPFSAGEWKDKEKAMCGAATKELIIIDGKKNLVSSTCCLIKLPDKIPNDNITSIISVLDQIKEKIDIDREILFLDQKFPIGSEVIIEEKNGKTYIAKIKEFLQTRKEIYRKFIEEELISGQAGDFISLKEKTMDRKKKRISTDEKDYFKEIGEKELSFLKSYLQPTKLTLIPIQGIWIGDKKGKYARIIGWKKESGLPVALLSPSNESKIIKGWNKKEGDFIKAIIHIERDRIPRNNQNPYTKRGWIGARTSEGIQIPIEFDEIVLSPLGYGLERLKGEKIKLSLKNINKETNQIYLSNISRVIEDLKNLYKKAGKETARLNGFVTEINEEEENVIVTVPRKDGVIHSFEIHKKYLPKQRVDNLRIGEKVVVELSSKGKDNKDKLSVKFLDEKEIQSIPKEWYYDITENRLHFPYCLEDKIFKKWPAQPVVKEIIKKHSWQYCFNARIIETETYKDLKNPYKILERGMRVKGKVKEITKNQDILLEIDLLQGSFPVTGLLSFKDKEISWNFIKSPDIIKIGETIDVRILYIDETVSSPLIVSRKEAFRAEASISGEKIGVLIGKDGVKIKEFKGNRDVNISIDDKEKKVIVKSPSHSIRDCVCEEISKWIRGLGEWKKD